MNFPQLEALIQKYNAYCTQMKNMPSICAITHFSGISYQDYYDLMRSLYRAPRKKTAFDEELLNALNMNMLDLPLFFSGYEKLQAEDLMSEALFARMLEGNIPSELEVKKAVGLSQLAKDKIINLNIKDLLGRGELITYQEMMFTWGRIVGDKEIKGYCAGFSLFIANAYSIANRPNALFPLETPIGQIKFLLQRFKNIFLSLPNQVRQQVNTNNFNTMRNYFTSTPIADQTTIELIIEGQKNQIPSHYKPMSIHFLSDTEMITFFDRLAAQFENPMSLMIIIHRLGYNDSHVLNLFFDLKKWGIFDSNMPEWIETNNPGLYLSKMYVYSIFMISCYATDTQCVLSMQNAKISLVHQGIWPQIHENQIALATIPGSLLRIAVRYNDIPLLKSLLNTDVIRYINAKYQDETPLWIAAFFGYKEIVALLCAKGANLEEKCNLETTPLMVAAQNRHPEVVKFLLAQGAHIYARNKRLDTPIIIAASHGAEEVVSVLLNHGANPNDVNVYNVSPLIGAAYSGDLPTVRTLLRRGANPHVIATTRKTAYQVALQEGHFACAEFIQQFSAAEFPQDSSVALPILHSESTITAIEIFQDCEEAPASLAQCYAALETVEDTGEYYGEQCYFDPFVAANTHCILINEMTLVCHQTGSSSVACDRFFSESCITKDERGFQFTYCEEDDGSEHTKTLVVQNLNHPPQLQSAEPPTASIYEFASTAGTAFTRATVTTLATRSSASLCRYLGCPDKATLASYCLRGLIRGIECYLSPTLIELQLAGCALEYLVDVAGKYIGISPSTRNMLQNGCATTWSIFFSDGSIGKRLTHSAVGLVSAVAGNKTAEWVSNKLGL